MPCNQEGEENRYPGQYAACLWVLEPRGKCGGMFLWRGCGCGGCRDIGEASGKFGPVHLGVVGENQTIIIRFAPGAGAIAGSESGQLLIFIGLWLVSEGKLAEFIACHTGATLEAFCNDVVFENVGDFVCRQFSNGQSFQDRLITSGECIDPDLDNL